jgi:hypothetical protein
MSDATQVGGGIVAGYNNEVGRCGAVIAGQGNDGYGFGAFIGGGYANRASGEYVVVTGGSRNWAAVDLEWLGGDIQGYCSACGK